MKYRRLGKTQLKVSEIGLGTWELSLKKRNIARKILEKAFEYGINLYDTADVYGWGKCEALIGETFKKIREEIIIVTKVGVNFYKKPISLDFSPHYIEKAVQKSLNRLHTKYIDILLLHRTPDTVKEFVKLSNLIKRLKRDGKIFYWGISVNIPQEVLAILQHVDDIEVIEIPYNIIYQEPRISLFSRAEKNKIGIIAREILLKGLFTGKMLKKSLSTNLKLNHISKEKVEDILQIIIDLLNYLHLKEEDLLTLAIGFALSDPRVSSALIGTSNIKHLEEDMNAYRKSLLFSTTYRLIEKYYENFL